MAAIINRGQTTISEGRNRRAAISHSISTFGNGGLSPVFWAVHFFARKNRRDASGVPARLHRGRAQ